MALGDRIRGIRAQKKFSQFELADRLKMHTSTVSRWENGERDPSATDLIALAQALSTTVSYLTGETDDPSPTALSDITSRITNAQGAIAQTNQSVNGDVRDNRLTVTTPSAPAPSPSLGKNGLPWWIDAISNTVLAVQRADTRELDSIACSLKIMTDMVDKVQQGIKKLP